jgi:hypothetical protein
MDYGARFYDPSIGRFTTVDPLADEPEQVDKSPYAYGWNNPIKYDDPDGKCPRCIKAAIKTTIKSIAKGKVDLGEFYDIAESVGTLVDGNLNMADAEAIFNLISPVSTKELKAGKKLAEKALDKVDEALDGVKKNKTHGNKLDDKPAEGYSLRDRNTKETKKYGETTRGEDKYGTGNQKRYTKKYLKENNVDYVRETSGTKKNMHIWQHEKIKDHKSHNEGERPRLNKSDY